MNRPKPRRSLQRTVQHVGAAAALLMALTFGGAAQAEITTLDFAPAPPTCGVTACGNGSTIDQGYGDSPRVDVSYATVNQVQVGQDLALLSHWTGGYGDLLHVVYGAPGTGFISQISFIPAAGYELALLSFDAGCYLNTAGCRTIDYSLLRGNGTALAGGSALVPLDGHASVLTNTGYYADGIRLRWGPDSYNGGLDNIRFDVRSIATMGGVPEPTTWALMILGFGMVGAALRRRKPALAPRTLIAA